MDTTQGKIKLEQAIDAGRASAMGLIERLHTDMPEDQLAKGAALRFGTKAFDAAPINDSPDPDKRFPAPELVMGVGDKGLRIHRHALSQLAGRAGVPGAYIADLAAGPEWQRKLAAGILNQHFHEGEPGTRYLVRSVRGVVRGVMSDRYRRLDNRPLVDGLAKVSAEVGAVAFSGVCTDVRVALKVVYPQVYIAAGDVMAFGLEWGNSDFGASRNYLRGFFLRLECLNGNKSENAMANVHLGRALSDDFELSQRTIDLDTKTTLSAMRDVVRGLLSPEKIKERIEIVEAAAARGADTKSLRMMMGKRVSKSEAERIVGAFESNDVVNLPAGDTMWRAANAVSWIAGQRDVDADRRLDLERLSGELMTGTREREDLADAA